MRFLDSASALQSIYETHNNCAAPLLFVTNKPEMENERLLVYKILSSVKLTQTAAVQATLCTSFVQTD